MYYEKHKHVQNLVTLKIHVTAAANLFFNQKTYTKLFLFCSYTEIFNYQLPI